MAFSQFSWCFEALVWTRSVQIGNWVIWLGRKMVCLGVAGDSLANNSKPTPYFKSHNGDMLEVDSRCCRQRNARVYCGRSRSAKNTL